jgi:asparagine synthase (glutamine-hydrolysing)
VPTPLTTIKNVFSLPAGHYLIYDGQTRTAQIEKYWSLDFSHEGSPRRDDVVEHTRRLLEESVRLHMLSDVPVGVFLSGGLDSSALTALASQGRGDPLRTISVIFEEKGYSEANSARLVAKKYATEHTEVLCRAEDFYQEIPLLFKSMDQPTVDGINTYFVSKAARQAGLKVVLSGLGGDEVFWGYTHFRRFARLTGSLALFGRLPALVRRPLLGAAKAYGKATGHYDWKKLEFLADPTPENYYLLIRGLYAPSQIKTLLDVGDSYLEAPAMKNGGLHTLNLDALSHLEFKGYLQNQLLKDADFMSMAHSIELRVPFLDHPLVEYLAGVPSHMKLDPRINKVLLANAMSTLLPQEIFCKPKKGFAFPFEHWIRRYSNDLCELALSDGLLHRKAVERIWDDFLRGRLHWSRPWALVVFSRALRAL